MHYLGMNLDIVLQVLYILVRGPPSAAPHERYSFSLRTFHLIYLTFYDLYKTLKNLGDFLKQCLNLKGRS